MTSIRKGSLELYDPSVHGKIKIRKERSVEVRG